MSRRVVADNEPSSSDESGIKDYGRKRIRPKQRSSDDDQSTDSSLPPWIDYSGRDQIPFTFWPYERHKLSKGDLARVRLLSSALPTNRAVPEIPEASHPSSSTSIHNILCTHVVDGSSIRLNTKAGTGGNKQAAAFRWM